MLKQLINIIDSKEFKESLDKPELWQSLNIDYHPPQVLRLYRNIHIDNKIHRLYLHRILRTKEPCLFHKHRWPSAIYIVEGSYEMGLSYSEKAMPLLATKIESPIISTLILSEHSGYEMLEPHGIHYVKPITKDSLSIMLSGEVFKDVYTKESVNKVLKPLTDLQKNNILKRFKTVYSN